jgi:hypothetical protein
LPFACPFVILQRVNTDSLPEGWAILRQWLPSELNEAARRYGFFERARGLQDAECWLRLIMMHVCGGLSLEQTVVRARELGMAQVSAVALFKRLRKAQRWLESLTTHLLKAQQKQLGRFQWPYAYRLRVIDATDIQEPGSTGTDLRLHYSVRLPELICEHFEITDDRGGEKLGRYEFGAGELVLVDRGYSHRAGVSHLLEAGAEVVGRWNPGGFPLEDAHGDPLEPLPQLRQLKDQQVGEWRVQFEYKGKSYALRLCAVRKSRLAAKRARHKVLRKAQNNGTQAQADTLELAGYVLVLTSLQTKALSGKAVLDLYRGRWQVELVFKRLKSLLKAGHVPKSNDDSAKAWMQAKILSALLVDRVMLEGKFFSPWGFAL